jgi:hypothetical protein
MFKFYQVFSGVNSTKFMVVRTSELLDIHAKFITHCNIFMAVRTNGYT